MPPAVVAVVASVATIAVKLFVKSKILAALLILAINVAAFVLTRRPQGKTNQGQELRLKLDPTMPRQICLGRSATGGSVVWAFTWGTSSGVPGGRYIVRIIALQDVPASGLVAVKEGKDTLVFNGDVTTGWRECTSHHKTDGGQNRLKMRVYLGSDPATADANLITWSGGLWTANHKGTNMCYAIMSCEYDPDGNAFPGGEPSLVFVLDGAKCYDDRKDSTKPGGSGAHRIDNPATWEFTRNTAVLAAQALRGFYSRDQLIIGAEAEERDLSTSMLFSAFNTADQNVTYSGGTQKRYEAGIMANSGDPLAGLLQELQAAYDGRIIDRGGAITLLPGATRTPVFNLTDDDIIWAAEKSWQPRATLTELYNHVDGAFVDEETVFSEKTFPPLRNATWEADDGGERFSLNVSYAALTDWARVQRITKRVHLASRFQGTVAFYLPLWGLEMEQGDWFTLTSDRFGLTNKYFEAVSVDLTADLRIAVVGRETSSTIDGWNHVVDEVARSDTTWTPPAIIMPSITAAAAGVKKQSTTGVESFGVKVTITGMPDTNMYTHLQVQLSPQDDNDPITDLGNITPINQDAEFYGLLPNTAYAVRVRGTDGSQHGPWTTWKNFTTPTATFGAISLSITPSTLTLQADYTGDITTSYPQYFGITVLQGSTNIAMSNSVQYAVTTEENCDVTVDTTNGSSTKGRVTLAADPTSSDSHFIVQVTVDGVVVGNVRGDIHVNVAAPPPPPSNKQLSFSNWNNITSTSHAQICVNIGTGIVVASGEKLYGSGTLSYQHVSSENRGSRTGYFKWQRSPTGAGTWTDFGTEIQGSISRTGGWLGPPGEEEWYDPTRGSVTLTQNIVTSAGTYDVRVVGRISSTTNSAQLQELAGVLTCEAKV